MFNELKRTGKQLERLDIDSFLLFGRAFSWHSLSAEPRIGGPYYCLSSCCQRASSQMARFSTLPDRVAVQNPSVQRIVSVVTALLRIVFDFDKSKLVAV